MDISNPLSYDDINFELCCVMFNIGAIHSLIAIDENRANVDVRLIFFGKIKGYCRPK